MKRGFSGQNVVKIVEMRKTTGKTGQSGRGQSRIFFFFFCCVSFPSYSILIFVFFVYSGIFTVHTDLGLARGANKPNNSMHLQRHRKFHIDALVNIQHGF